MLGQGGVLACSGHIGCWSCPWTTETTGPTEPLSCGRSYAEHLGPSHLVHVGRGGRGLACTELGGPEAFPWLDGGFEACGWGLLLLYTHLSSEQQGCGVGRTSALLSFIRCLCVLTRSQFWAICPTETPHYSLRAVKHNRWERPHSVSFILKI